MGWFAIIAQFVLMIQNRQADILETTVRFFSFFTILTNILVALFFTTSAFRLKGFPFKLFSAKTTITALTAFIFIVGLVYQIALRQVWAPTGLQYVVDELLHTVIPLFMLGYWHSNMKKEDLAIQPLLKWMIYPLTYILYILVRGSLSGYYPYPFLNIPEIGYQSAAINIAAIFMLMLITLTVLSIVGKRLIKS